MPKPVVIVRDERPTQPVLTSFTLSTAPWVKVYTFPSNTSVWKLYNSSVAQPIWYGYRKNQSDPNVLAILDTIVYRTRPTSLWLRRTNAATNPVVFLEVWLYEEGK